jgi:prepilin-type N-terminal cleavage/methylation domain-containing protein
MTNRFSQSADATRAPGFWVQGFTLVEMLVALAVSSIVLAVLFGVFAGLVRSYTTQNVAAEIQQTVRAGIDYMAEDIMMAGFNPRAGSFTAFEEADATRIRVRFDRNTDLEDSSPDFGDVAYEWIEADQRVYQTEGGSTQPYIDNVTDLTFIYRNAAGEDLVNDLGLSYPIASSLDRAEIRTVEISITVQEPAGRDKLVNRTYTTRVGCRNMGL